MTASMIRKIGAIVALGCVGFASPAMSQNVQSLTVDSVATGWSYEGLYVIVTRDITQSEAGTTGCGPTNTLILASDNPMRKDIADLVKIAVSTGKPINVYIGGCFNGTAYKLQSATLRRQ